MENQLKPLILRTLPTASRFLYAECTKCLQCRVSETSLSIYQHDDGFRYNLSYADRENLKAWMIYGGFCFSLDELEADLKSIRERLNHRRLVTA